MVLGENADGYVTQALSGASGQTLWTYRSSADWRFPTVTGPLDEVAGADLVTTSFAWGFDEAGAIVIDRRSGLTGEVLSTTEHEMPAAPEDANGIATWRCAVGSGDGDGDGIGGVTVGWVQQTYDYDTETDEEQLLSLDSAAIAESGRSGEARRRVSAANEIPLLFPFDDLDGDGLVDLMDERVRFAENPHDTSTWAASHFSDAPSMWTHSARADYLYLRTAGDQDGELGDELLLESFNEDEGRWSSTVQSLSGRTAGLRWQLPTR